MTPRMRNGKRTRTYQSWLCMRSRCYRKTDHNYPAYGGRGIRVCKRWRDSYDAFVNDMGRRPPGCTLDRKNVNRDYGPTNCKWSKLSTQNRNRRPVKREPNGWFASTGKGKGKRK